MDEQEYQRKREEYKAKCQELDEKFDQYNGLVNQFNELLDEQFALMANPLMLWKFFLLYRWFAKKFAALEKQMEALKPYVSMKHPLALDFLHLRHDINRHDYGDLVPGEWPIGTTVDVTMEDGRKRKHTVQWSALNEDGNLFYIGNPIPDETEEEAQKMREREEQKQRIERIDSWFGKVNHVMTFPLNHKLTIMIVASIACFPAWASLPHLNTSWFLYSIAILDLLGIFIWAGIDSFFRDAERANTKTLKLSLRISGFVLFMIGLLVLLLNISALLAHLGLR